MNYYIDETTGTLYAYDDDQVAEGYVKEGLIPCDPRPTPEHVWQNGWVLPDPVPLTPEQHNAEIRGQIDELERSSLMNRAVREWVLLKWELEDGPKRAELMSVELGRTVTVEEALASLPAYAKIKALDAQIIALRNLMV